MLNWSFYNFIRSERHKLSLSPQLCSSSERPLQYLSLLVYFLRVFDQSLQQWSWGVVKVLTEYDWDVDQVNHERLEE